jgi:predicted extracellular nuclease
VLAVATMNVLNLAPPGVVFYPNQEPYDQAQYDRKVDWLGAQLRRLNADVIGLQEIWHEQCLRDVVAASGLRYATVVAPGAEQGATGTPRLGLITRLAVQSLDSIRAFAPAEQVAVPEVGVHAAFERPILQARLRIEDDALPLHLLVTHMKSKRPKFLQDEAGNPLEDRDDPRVLARAQLRSLVMRGAEAAALRGIIVPLLQRTREPLVLMGDLNDTAHAVTTQMMASNQSVAFDRQARDTALWHALDVQTAPSVKGSVGYSHIHQGVPDTLDQIWVSEEFVATSKFGRGDVLRVEYFNDHLLEPRDGTRSDHGFVRALLRWRAP